MRDNNQSFYPSEDEVEHLEQMAHLPWYIEEADLTTREENENDLFLSDLDLYQYAAEHGRC